MILDNDNRDIPNQVNLPAKITTYSANSRFKSRLYYQKFKKNIEFNNYRKLVKLTNKLNDQLNDNESINIKEELEFLQNAIGFDPNIYKVNPKKLISHPDKISLCKEIVCICDSINKT